MIELLVDLVQTVIFYTVVLPSLALYMGYGLKLGIPAARKSVEEARVRQNAARARVAMTSGGRGNDPRTQMIAELDMEADRREANTRARLTALGYAVAWPVMLVDEKVTDDPQRKQEALQTLNQFELYKAELEEAKKQLALESSSSNSHMKKRFGSNSPMFDVNGDRY